MTPRKNEITYENAVNLKNPLFIDVRAPVEYQKDHIPGSINIPLFDNEERSEIGKIYKLLGKDDAVVRGSEIAGNKIGDIVANVRNIKNRDIIIYCFRGGMRSSSLVTLLNSLELEVRKLEGGYKNYRKFIRNEVENLNIKQDLFVLHGLTGTGKTEIIRKIKNSIDLEKIAGHRSSVFGGIGLEKNTQKKFESLLIQKINYLKNERYIFVEGESRKIGDLHIPEKLLQRMYNSPGILIEAPVERRVDILLDEYKNFELNPDEVITIIESISGRLGKKDTNTLIELFKKGLLFEFTALLLEKYYDPLYKHSLNKMEFITKIENLDSTKISQELINIADEYMTNNIHKK